MTAHSLEDLPDEWSGPILDLVDQARAAAAPPADDGGAWATAEAGQVRRRTGYQAARRTASAGQYAAHILRLRALERVDQGEDHPWTVALAVAGAAMSSWGWDERMQSALDLRKAVKDLPADEHVTSAQPARLVATWLAHNAGAELVPATGRLCAYVLEHASITPRTLAPAWYATHGDRLLVELVARGTPREGRPTRQDAAHHALLCVAVRGVHAAKVMPKVELARRAGLSRATVDAWLKAEANRAS